MTNPPNPPNPQKRWKAPKPAPGSKKLIIAAAKRAKQRNK
jgi:hypothetical protein